MKRSMKSKFMTQNLETREMLDIWEGCARGSRQSEPGLSREMPSSLEDKGRQGTQWNAAGRAVTGSIPKLVSLRSPPAHGFSDNNYHFLPILYLFFSYLSRLSIFEATF